jgi:DNA mismatch repair protein MSH5
VRLDKEIEIVHALAIRVLEHEKLLVAVSDLCGELDSLLALAEGASKFGFSPPHIITKNIIDIKEGWHPLQELIVDRYIPNDAILVGGAGNNEEHMEESASTPCETSDSNLIGISGPSTFLMTGPNYSGKSVYLKQIAIIVYLAHIGSFVPASSATIGLTDKILTRIATRESVSQAQSAFMIDLQQIALATRMATRRSLILIDEFGKGTNASDGAGLAAAVFEHFLSLGTQCPKVLGATHFHEIFESGFVHPRPELAFGHMHVRIDRDAVDLEDQVRYMYELRSGRNLSSFGTVCAALNGIDPAVIEHADDLILMSARGEDLVTACSRITLEEEREAEEAELVARAFLELELRDGVSAKEAKDTLRRILGVATE